MPAESLDGLTSPPEWSTNYFRRTFTVRSEATSIQKPFSTSSNPWMWLDLLIENATDSKDAIS